MITVWCMNTGGHAPASEVYTLKRQVKRHLKEPFNFVCITDDVIHGVERMKPINDLPGWWGKTNLFAPSVSRPRNLWLDLDVTITGDLTPLVQPLWAASQLRVARNWAQSGHGGCQSSVMYWEGAKARVIHDEFDHAWAHWPPRTDRFWPNRQVQWGDQEWITYQRDTGRIQVEYFDPAHVVSYKYHCRDGVPDDCRVAVFHGNPKPSEVGDGWVKQCRA